MSEKVSPQAMRLENENLRGDRLSSLAPAPNSRKTPAPQAGSLPSAAEIDDMIERLLDAQQDINLSANETMSQPLCDASALIDQVETMLRRVRSAALAATEGSADV